MKNVLNKLIEHKTLSREEAKQILTNLAEGKYNSSQVAAFLTIFLMRTITVDELTGFREAMLDLCISVDLGNTDCIDLCGTGGDGKDTFNISTLASFIVAGAGQPVAKHGNNGVSSVCGSSNLLAHFGYIFTNDEEKLRSSIASSNLCFLHAPLFHPAMKNVAPIRKELGIKTFFNMLGPMVNPARPKKQLVGVFSLELARLYAYLYQQLDVDFIIVHSLDGYDEVSLTGPIKMISRQGEKVLYPEDLGFQRHNPDALKGGKSVEESADIFEQVLQGKGSRAQNEVVLANAGLAIYCSQDQLSLQDAMKEAEKSLSTGAAYDTFKNLIQDS